MTCHVVKNIQFACLCTGPYDTSSSLSGKDVNFFIAIYSWKTIFAFIARYLDLLLFELHVIPKIDWLSNSYSELYSPRSYDKPIQKWTWLNHVEKETEENFSNLDFCLVLFESLWLRYHSNLRHCVKVSWVFHRLHTSYEFLFLVCTSLTYTI